MGAPAKSLGGGPLCSPLDDATLMRGDMMSYLLISTGNVMISTVPEAAFLIM